MKNPTKLLHKAFLCMTLLSVVLSGCITAPKSLPESMAVASTATATRDVWATSIAQTQIAVAPEGTLAARPTFTSVPTETPFPTLTKNPKFLLTQLPADQVYVAYEGPCEAIRDLGGINHEIGEFMMDDTEFKMTWGLKNIGSCEIGPGYVLTFIDGEDMGDDKGKLQTVLSPMENGKVSVDLKAPNDPGTYEAHYKFKNPAGQFFGPVFVVNIVVPGLTCDAWREEGFDYGLIRSYQGSSGPVIQYWSEKNWSDSGIYSFDEIFFWIVYYWDSKYNPIPHSSMRAYCGKFLPPEEYDPDVTYEVIIKY